MKRWYGAIFNVHILLKCCFIMKEIVYLLFLNDIDNDNVIKICVVSL